jgi:hypothetical protein
MMISCGCFASEMTGGAAGLFAAAANFSVFRGQHFSSQGCE